jgi:perosamine synthetase
MIPRLRPPFSLAELVRAFASQTRNSQTALEGEMAERFGFAAAILFPYGRFALYCLLKALGWSDRKVAVPGYTCVVVPHAVVLAANQVHFMDCEADHFNVSAHTLAAALRARPDMVIATPLFGYPIDRPGYDAAMRGSTHRPFMLFDAAHAFGIEDSQGFQFADADGALLGLGAGKIISALNGGVLLLRDAGLCRNVREYRDRWLRSPSRVQAWKYLAYGAALTAAFREPGLSLADCLERRSSLLYRYTDRYYGKQGPSMPDDAWIRPTAFQAQLGRLQLARYDQLVVRRREVSQWYEAKLGAAGFRVFSWNALPTYSHFPLVVGNRDRACEIMRRDGMQLGTLIDYACPDMPGYESHAGTCANASRFARHMVNLPNWPGMSERRVRLVVDGLARLRDRFPEWLVPDSPSGASCQVEPLPRSAA